MVFKMGFDFVDLIHVADHRDQLQAPVNIVMNSDSIG
jgi:hypothetical protein